MQIKILRQCATPYGQFSEGDITEIPDDVAQKWIKSGLAEVTGVTHKDEDKAGVTPVTNTGDSVTGGKNVTDKKQKAAFRVQRFRAKGKMITIRHTDGRVETLRGDQALKLVQEGKAELIGETAMTGPPETR